MEQVVMVIFFLGLIFGGLFGLFFKWLVHKGNWDEIHSERHCRKIQNTINSKRGEIK